jgi:two-component system, NtrC family, sensor kinase
MSRAEAKRVAQDECDDRPSRVVAIGSERREESGVRSLLPARESLAPTQRGEHSERLARIGTLTASIAHELAAPAGFILANLEAMAAMVNEMAAQPATASEPERLRELQEICEDNLAGIRIVFDMVSTLRNFARSHDAVRFVAIDEVIQAAVRLVGPTVRARAQLVLDLEPVPTFPGETTRLVQVLTNLLSNAAQAIRLGAVQENRVVVATRLRDGCCVVSVADTGHGMPESVHRRVFEPFYTTKQAGEGTGLGLSVCLDIARRHGGTLRCTSAPGAGTRFELVLPLSPACTPETFA